MNTLAYRIETMNHICNPDCGENGNSRTKAFIPILKGTTKISLTNVAEYFAMHKQTEWGLIDIPNMAPPFCQFFVEWAEPKSWNTERGIVNIGEDQQIGIYCLALDIETATKDMVEKTIRLFTGATQNPDYKSVCEGWDDIINKSKWILCLDFWSACGRSPFFNRPIWPAIQAFILVDKSGKGLVEFVTGVGCFRVKCATVPEDNPFLTYTKIFGLGLSFMHCKNVTRTKTEIITNPKAVKNNHAPSKQVYYVLNIEPMKEVLKKDGGSEYTGIKKAMHICRGHFSTYTQDAKLFGKYSGTFWIPDHIRGNQSNGIIDKDYSVNPKE